MSLPTRKQRGVLLTEVSSLPSPGVLGPGAIGSIKSPVQSYGETAGPMREEDDSPEEDDSGALSATFKENITYDPVCPHCNEVMYEKHFVPDQNGDNLWIHRGDCYDKGSFKIVWPDQKEQDAESAATSEYLKSGTTNESIETAEVDRFISEAVEIDRDEYVSPEMDHIYNEMFADECGHDPVMDQIAEDC